MSPKPRAVGDAGASWRGWRASGCPLASALVSVGRFYTSPIIFAFDPFVGYFSGTLYDTVIDAGAALYTYRLGSLATLAFVVSIRLGDDAR